MGSIPPNYTTTKTSILALSPVGYYPQLVTARVDNAADFLVKNKAIPAISYLFDIVHHEMDSQRDADFIEASDEILARIRANYQELSNRLAGLWLLQPPDNNVLQQIFQLERQMNVLFAAAAGLEVRADENSVMLANTRVQVQAHPRRPEQGPNSGAGGGAGAGGSARVN